MIVWPFLPSLGIATITEDLEWMTDVLQSPTGAEQRRMLRLSPRRTLAGTVAVHGPDRARFDLMIQAAGGNTFGLPIWVDGQFVSEVPAGASRIACETAGLDFVAGGRAVVFASRSITHELIEIESVDADGLTLAAPVASRWPAGSSIYPVREAVFAEFPEVTRRTPDFFQAETRWRIVEPCDYPAQLPTETYRGHPVLDTCLHIAQEPTQGYSRITLTLDNETGVPRVTDTAGRGFALRQWRFLARSRHDRPQIRCLFYGLRGRQGAIWVPTRTHDLQLISASGSAITVRDVGYSAYGVGVMGRQDVRITLANGATHNRRVLSANPAAAGTEVLVLDSALPAGITPAAVRRIEYLTLSRLDADAVTFEYHARRDGMMTASVNFRGIRDDLETP